MLLLVLVLLLLLLLESGRSITITSTISLSTSTISWQCLQESQPASYHLGEAEANSQLSIDSRTAT